MTQTILHLAPAADFSAAPAEGPYAPASLAAEGFVHCTATSDVLLHVANHFYRAAPGDFVVLELDLARLSAPVRFEAPAPPALPGSPLAGVSFPHLYGPINREAILAVTLARRDADGTFLAL